MLNTTGAININTPGALATSLYICGAAAVLRDKLSVDKLIAFSRTTDVQLEQLAAEASDQLVRCHAINYDACFIILTF